MISEETLRKYFDAVVLSNYSPGEMGWLWKEFLFHKDILDEEVEKVSNKVLEDYKKNDYWPLA